MFVLEDYQQCQIIYTLLDLQIMMKYLCLLQSEAERVRMKHWLEKLYIQHRLLINNWLTADTKKDHHSEQFLHREIAFYWL